MIRIIEGHTMQFTIANGGRKGMYRHRTSFRREIDLSFRSVRTASAPHYHTVNEIKKHHFVYNRAVVVSVEELVTP